MSVRANYHCEVCDLNCHDKTKYERHILTNKHINKLHEEVSGASKHVCLCGKKYNHRQGLFVHKKTCRGGSVKLTENAPDLTQMVIELVKSNAILVEAQRQSQLQAMELQQQVLTLCHNGTHHNTTINNNTNSHNKSFNLNFFLNEQCKNAINLSKFIDDLEVTRDDLMNTGQLGFVEGISKIIMDHLNRMSLYERPIHCTDIKRETLYIKENNEWNKEEDNAKMDAAIQKLTNKSVRTLTQWKRENPDYADGDSEFSHMCISMQRNSQAGYDRDAWYPKVVRAVARGTILDKNKLISSS
jgi:hypothetical protein